jgi:hypothetical protein
MFCRFFNPRSDRWSDHFMIDGILIKPINEIGEVTARVLQLNSSDRLLEREILLSIGRYPHPSARLIDGLSEGR